MLYKDVEKIIEENKKDNRYMDIEAHEYRMTKSNKIILLLAILYQTKENKRKYPYDKVMTFRGYCTKLFKSLDEYNEWYNKLSNLEPIIELTAPANADYFMKG